MPAIEMLLRTVSAFIVLYILCRILGKKLISQMTFFDFVAGITIGSIAASIMFMNDVKLLVGLFGLTVFCLLALLTNFISIKSFYARKVLEGEPTVLIKDGKVYESGMKKAKFTIDDLITHLRKKNVFYIDQVEIAILETDGSVSVLRKTEHLPATQKDVEKVQLSRGLPEVFIMNGKVLHDTLKILDKDIQWVEDVLKVNGVTSPKQVFLAQVDIQGNVYIDQREDK